MGRYKIVDRRGERLDRERKEREAEEIHRRSDELWDQCFAEGCMERLGEDHPDFYCEAHRDQGAPD